MNLRKTISYAQNNQPNALKELTEWLRIPSVSTQDQHRPDMLRAAEWLTEHMRHIGLENVELIKTDRHPLVYADWLNAGKDAPTVLIYGHYDIQPPDPLELWDTPPFEPTVLNNYLYARGSSDDKGQTFIHLKAIEAYLKTAGKLPINVKLIIEGEEEDGGESLEAYLPVNKEKLSADVALISDTGIFSPDQPAITYGLRGNCYMLLDLMGPAIDLHSGSYGGGINNPLNELGRIIAKLQDKDGHILIPGFYDKVRPIPANELKMLNQLPFDVPSWLADTGAPDIWGEPAYSLIERLSSRPTLDVHGIIGGYTAKGGKTVLPAKVHAKISMRLVPDQHPTEIAQLFTEYVQSILPPTITAKIRYHSGSPASVSDITTPAMQSAKQAYAEVFPNEPVFLRVGGSIPVVGQLQEHLGLETVLMGFGLPDDHIHSPNERFYLPNFYRGIETVIHFFSLYE